MGVSRTAVTVTLGVVMLSGCTAVTVPATPTVPSQSSTPVSPTRMNTAAETRFGLNVADSSALNTAETTLGVKASVVGLFADFAHNPDFPTRTATELRNRGATLMVSWEPWDWNNPNPESPPYRLTAITAGRHDVRIDTWARQIRAFGSPVLIRFAPEQNGDWRPWSVGVNSNTAAGYRQAWTHVVSRFRSAGATNAKWVWNPIVDVGAASPMAVSFPGNNLVDYVGLDGYNWGSTRKWGWQSYDDIFASSVATVKRLAPGKPWMIAEVGCAPGSGKPAWITTVFSRARKDGAWAVVWFEYVKETDWRLSQDRASSRAVSALARQPGYRFG